MRVDVVAADVGLGRAHRHRHPAFVHQRSDLGRRHGVGAGLPRRGWRARRSVGVRRGRRRSGQVVRGHRRRRLVGVLRQFTARSRDRYRDLQSYPPAGAQPGVGRERAGSRLLLRTARSPVRRARHAGQRLRHLHRCRRPPPRRRRKTPHRGRRFRRERRRSTPARQLRRHRDSHPSARTSVT